MASNENPRSAECAKDELGEIFETMDLYSLDTYAAVVRWTKANRPEWKPLVYRKYFPQIAEYAESLSEASD